jgi:integrase
MSAAGARGDHIMNFHDDEQRTRRQRPKAFSTAEVETILSATLEPAPGTLTPKHAAARCWVPWLCAHLGARTGEVVRLRGSDVRQVDGIWLVSIRSDNRFPSNARMRAIPLHPQLVEQGFPRFAEESGDGPLFYDPDGQTVGRGGVDPVQKVIAWIGRWICQLGVDDPDILPNHAWRYRFQMTALRSGMNRTVLDYALGRAQPMSHKQFSGFSPDVLLHEISKLPKIEIARA